MGYFGINILNTILKTKSKVPGGGGGDVKSNTIL
jgi:hypothetical protein